MIGIYSVVLGIITVLVAVMLIRKEFGNSFVMNYKKYEALSDDHLKDFLKRLDGIEAEVNLLNESVYDILSDLEGKYSVLVKEDELKDENIEQINSEIDGLQRRLKKGESTVTAEISRLSKQINTFMNAVEKSENCSIQTDDHNIEEKTAIERNTSQSGNWVTADDGITIDNDSALRGKIIELRHRGYSLSRIAKELDIGIGELQLFLNINK